MTSVETAVAMDRLIAFVNTLDIDAGTDELATPGQVRDWLSAQGLLPDGANVTSSDVAQAHRLREALRSALLAHDAHGDVPTPPPDDTSVPLRLVIGADGGVSLAPAAKGVDAALAQLVLPIPAAAADGTWERVKACPKDTCQWAFFDRSRNRSRRWCSMEVCGNQEKTRSFRDRHRDRD